MVPLVLIEQGQLTRASKALLDAASVNRELHDHAALRWSLAGLAIAEAMSGHTARAAAAAAELDGLPVGSMLIYEPDLVERSRAWLSVATGELSQACEILTAAADRAAAVKLRIAEARVLHDLARLGQPGQVAPRLAAARDHQRVEHQVGDKPSGADVNLAAAGPTDDRDLGSLYAVRPDADHDRVGRAGRGGAELILRQVVCRGRSCGRRPSLARPCGVARDRRAALSI